MSGRFLLLVRAKQLGNRGPVCITGGSSERHDAVQDRGPARQHLANDVRHHDVVGEDRSVADAAGRQAGGKLGIVELYPHCEGGAGRTLGTTPLPEVSTCPVESA